MLKAYHESHRPTECNVCKKQTQKLAGQIAATSSAALLDKLLEMCGFMSSYSDACKTTVLQNFDLIHE